MYQLAPGGSLKQPSPALSADYDWARLWRGLSARRGLFAMVFAIVFLAVVLYTFLMPRTYTANVKLIAGNGGHGTQSHDSAIGGTTLPLLNALLEASGIQSSETYAELFQETPVAQRVVADLHLPLSSTDLLKHVSVKPITNTTLLDLAVVWGDRATAAMVANAFARSFVVQERHLIASQADAAIVQLGHEVPRAQARATAAQSALTSFEAKNDLADIQVQTQNIIGVAAGIDAKINAVQLDRGQSQAQLASLSGQLAHLSATSDGLTSTAPNPVLSQLQTQFAQVTVQLESARQQYTEQHPTVIALKHQEEELRREMARTPATIVSAANRIPNPLYQQIDQQSATLRAQVASDAAQLQQLRVQQAAMKPTIAALPSKAARLFELQRASKMTEDVLSALEQKLNEASISKTTALSDVTITQPASASNTIVKPSRTINLVVGFLLSIVAAAGSVLFAQAFDRRIRDARQIEEDFQLPVLASMPKLSDLRNALPAVRGMQNSISDTSRPLAKADAPWVQAFAVESYLQLVTAIRYSSDIDRPIRRITFTSPTQGDGKSMIAVNTAITMARIEPRVLLIDADLRRPSLHSKLSHPFGPGLSDALVGNAQLDDIIVPTKHDGLDLLMCGTRTPNSVKLLQSKRFDDLLLELSSKYATIIIDAPALVPVIDAAILATKADGTVLVVAIGETDTSAVRRALQKLQSVGANNLLGTVANGIRPTKRELYDDYFMYMNPKDQLALP